MTHIQGYHQEMVESFPHSRQTHLRRTCSERPILVVTNPPNLLNFSNKSMQTTPLSALGMKTTKTTKKEDKNENNEEEERVSRIRFELC